MDTKAKQDFILLIDVAECQQLIKDCVVALTHERALLATANHHPRPVDEETRKLLGLGPNNGLSTLDMAEARVVYYEAAQDRLWDWYRRLTDGQAGRFGT